MRRVDPRTRPGYIVYAGDPLGTLEDGHAAVAEDDVVVDQVHHDADGWSVAYHPVRVRDHSQPAA